MLVKDVPIYPIDQENVTPDRCFLQAELDFYEAYNWCLNPYPTVGEACGYLRGEIQRFDNVPSGWQAKEVATNIFLLSCALLNSVEEYLRGPTLRLPRQVASLRLGRGARWTTEAVAGLLRRRQRAQVRRWRDDWKAVLRAFLSIMFVEKNFNAVALAKAAEALGQQLQTPLPRDLESEHIGVPSPFGRLDLTHLDVLALGREYVTRFPDRSQPILLLGLRTSGSYFAPLLEVYFEGEGYHKVTSLTVQAQKGPGRAERKELARCASQNYVAVIVDDPPHTAGTILRALDVARRAGFGRGEVKILAPTHAARRNWSKSLPDDLVVSLAPEQWHMKQLLGQAVAEQRLAEYFRNRGFRSVSLINSNRVEAFNNQLQTLSGGGRGTRLKQIYEVQLEALSGHKETRYVIAKSVGWGWLGYHALLAGRRLSGLVPPILGLRDGILYSEWIPQLSMDQQEKMHRQDVVRTTAAYVAARVRSLGLVSTPISGKGLKRDCNGVRLLAKVLSRANGRFGADTLTRPRLERRLSQEPCPFPTLIDGRMDRAKWIQGSLGSLKTDYEHHGLGKAELNVIDPAYDLADTIRDRALTPEEESELIQRYVRETGDAIADHRLFVNKLLSGLWAMESAQHHLFTSSRSYDRQQEHHQRYMGAWHFLTVHTARFCAGHFLPQSALQWKAPLVALDIDGVVDRRLFGFPCTTAAGMEALALLNSHGFSVALNTARSVDEVKDYCQAYSLSGGVAELGSYLWDAVAQRGRPLIGNNAIRQLAKLRNTLQMVPGVFLDDRHQYSIRAFVYQDKAHGMLPSLLNAVRSLNVGDGVPTPLPTPMMHHLMATLELDCLSFHHTRMDTTIVAKDIDKGVGLMALRDWVMEPDAETIAVGDSEMDLAMFRAATRSFAPAHIDCARKAKLLGCQIAQKPYQRGLLEIVRSLVHPDGKRCERCGNVTSMLRERSSLFLELLQNADHTPITKLIGALVDPATFRILLQ